MLNEDLLLVILKNSDNSISHNIWNIHTGVPAISLESEEIVVGLDPQQKLLITSNPSQGLLTIKNLRDGKIQGNIYVGNGPSQFLQVSADGQKLLTSIGKGLFTLWDIKSRTRLGVIEDETSPIRGAQFVPQADTVLSWHEDHKVKLWDALTSSYLRTLSAEHDKKRPQPALSSNGLKLCTVFDFAVQITDMREHELTATIDFPHS